MHTPETQRILRDTLEHALRDGDTIRASNLWDMLRDAEATSPQPLHPVRPAVHPH